jgi:hypothetical protein
MNRTKLALSIHVIAVIAAAGILIMATENVFALPTKSNTPSSTNSAGVDPQDQSTGPHDEQTTASSVDNHNDGETNDDHNSASAGPSVVGDGEQKDSTESGK